MITPVFLIIFSFATNFVEQSDNDNSRIFLNSKFQTYAIDSLHHSYFTDAFLKVLESDGGEDGVIDVKEALDIMYANNLRSDTTLINKVKESEAEFNFIQRDAKAKGKNYALLVSLEEFDNYPRLSGPARDLELINNLLKDNFGFETEELMNPTKTEFLGKLRSYAQKEYGKNDQLLIYLVSRGAYDVLLNRDYIVFKDSKPDDELKMSFIAHTQLQGLTANFMVNKLMLIVDAGAR